MALDPEHMRGLIKQFAPSWTIGPFTGRVSVVQNPEKFELFRQIAQIHNISRDLLSTENSL